MGKCSIISCGPTGGDWDGDGFSIGVNDAEKFGKPVSALVCVNSQFDPGRMKIIRETKAPAGFYSQLNSWDKHPSFICLPAMKKFSNKVEFGKIYHSITSPIVAISLAAVLQFDEIVVYGVDFDNHPIVKGDVMHREIDVYKRFIECVESKYKISVDLRCRIKNLMF